YLAEWLLEKGYKVYGVWVKGSVGNYTNIAGIINQIEVFEPATQNGAQLAKLIRQIRPDEMYILNAPLRRSHALRLEQVEPHAAETLQVLEAIRKYAPQTKLFQSVSPEVYGNKTSWPIHEGSPFYPVTSFGMAELYAVWMVRNFRESYGIFAANGILFSHTSPRCKSQCLTQEIAAQMGAIASGEKTVLHLGNLDIVRDWGFAGDYVKAMWQMLQGEEAEDYVIATGKGHSVREFVETCATRLGIELVWEGKGKEERGYDAVTGRMIVQVCPQRCRTVETDLIASPRKAKEKLGWQSQTSFDTWVDALLSSSLSIKEDYLQHA
ncbi:MAG: GDP-mannose 4,6-dehydratase, partial [Bacteroidota bacterium]